jgi:hypothetical protein
MPRLPAMPRLTKQHLRWLIALFILVLSITLYSYHQTLTQTHTQHHTHTHKQPQTNGPLAPCRMPLPEDCRNFDLYDGRGPQNFEKVIKKAKNDGLEWLELTSQKLNEWDVGTARDGEGRRGTSPYALGLMKISGRYQVSTLSWRNRQMLTDPARIEAMLDMYQKSLVSVPISCDHAGGEYHSWPETPYDGRNSNFVPCGRTPLPDFARINATHILDLGEGMDNYRLFATSSTNMGHTWRTDPPLIVLLEGAFDKHMLSPGQCKWGFELE